MKPVEDHMLKIYTSENPDQRCGVQAQFRELITLEFISALHKLWSKIVVGT